MSWYHSCTCMVGCPRHRHPKVFPLIERKDISQFIWNFTHMWRKYSKFTSACSKSSSRFHIWKYHLQMSWCFSTVPAALYIETDTPAPSIDKACISKRCCARGEFTWLIPLFTDFSLIFAHFSSGFRPWVVSKCGARIVVRISCFARKEEFLEGCRFHCTMSMC